MTTNVNMKFLATPPPLDNILYFNKFEFVIMKHNLENGIKLELNTATETNQSLIKFEHEKIHIKSDPLDTEDNESQVIDNGPGSDSESFDNFVKIEETEESEQKYTCNQCGKIYKCIKALKKHEKFHAGKFKCEFCGLSVTARDVLERHINNRHKGPYPCEFCGKLFSSVRAVGKHRDSSHLGKARPRKKVEIVKCTVCEKECHGERKLKEHMVCHSTEKPYTCDVCGTSFARKSSFYIHKKGHSEEQYSCDICGKAFNLPQYLVLHKRTHTDITYNCSMCEKTFASKSGLRKHVKSHTGLGLYHCELCEKTFNAKYMLTRHERTHSGVKPFYCEACNMSFYSKDELVKHKKLSKGHADNVKKMGGSTDGVVNELKNEKAD